MTEKGTSKKRNVKILHKKRAQDEFRLDCEGKTMFNRTNEIVKESRIYGLKRGEMVKTRGNSYQRVRSRFRVEATASPALPSDEQVLDGKEVECGTRAKAALSILSNGLTLRYRLVLKETSYIPEMVVDLNLVPSVRVVLEAALQHHPSSPHALSAYHSPVLHTDLTRSGTAAGTVLEDTG
ncbi:hypothetical protein BLNAU_6767 [Blattamonas nauphoetae]|uniref:Uncharacterized protein n=1 Tax=Blattamonas nauphoetae TaxID=2049346 RepID=A0ABQ9Y3J0_9EUKA|nr:hypothetical protein BLNAU_6767 [Blattamonas nauphoetae]